MERAMSDIGHNAPPPHEAFAMEIEELFSMVASAGPVTTDEQDAQMDALLDDIRKARKATDEQRAKEKKPHDDAGKAVQALYKPLLDKADRASDEAKKLLTPYRQQKQREKEVAAQKAREEAEALQKAAQEALQASDDLEKRFEAELAIKAGEKLFAQAKRIDKAPRGTRTIWSAHIEDRRKALLFLIEKFPERFEALIQHMADAEARGARGAIPGIRYDSEEIAN